MTDGGDMPVPLKAVAEALVIVSAFVCAIEGFAFGLIALAEYLLPWWALLCVAFPPLVLLAGMILWLVAWRIERRLELEGDGGWRSATGWRPGIGYGASLSAGHGKCAHDFYPGDCPVCAHFDGIEERDNAIEVRDRMAKGEL
jgi:hypothetical protein